MRAAALVVAVWIRHPGVIVAMTVHTDRLQPSPRISATGEFTSVDQALLDHLGEPAQGHVLAATLSRRNRRPPVASTPTDSIEEPIDFERLPSRFAGVTYLRRRYREAGPWRREGMPTGINNPRLRQLADIT